MPTAHDWKILWPQARIHAPTCRSVTELAERLSRSDRKMSRSTLKDAMARDGITREDLKLGADLAGRERILEGDEGQNMKTLVFQGQRILTPKQLLAYCEIDLSVWRQVKCEVNKWEVGAKVVQRDLEWHEGVLSGTVRSTGKLTIEPLFQIKIRLERIVPIPMFPHIQPVTLTPGAFKPPQKKPRKLWMRSLVWTDPHFWYRDDEAGGLQPLHDRGVLDILCQVAELLEVDTIHCLGDVFDLPDLSRFWQDPAVTGFWQPAIEEGAYWFLQLARIAPLRVHEGNHDFRLPKSMATHFRAAYQIKAANRLHLPPALSVQGLLAFAEMGIEWIGNYPKDEEWLNEALVLKHGDMVRQGAGATVAAMVKMIEASTCFGHIHRVEMASETKQHTQDKRVVTACSVGCACHTDGRVPGAAYPNWQKGFAVVEYDPEGTDHSIQPYTIKDGQVVVAGSLVTARDRMADIRKACPRWFN